MDIWNPSNLIVFLAFFIPGFISQKVYGLIVPDDDQDSTTVLYSAVAYSSLCYAVASPIIWWLAMSRQPVSPFIIIPALVIILLVIPAVLPVIWLWLRRRPFIRARTLSPIKRPWDFVFNGRSEYWVIVTFKNGEKIGGIYGRNSFSSSYPRKEQIYLEKAWVLGEDGTFVHEAPESKGVIILSDEIASIEIFSSPEGNHV